ncbi:hypothetical protein FQN49_005485 [Arthroderma sp. PD_2]|nr:hypothetical protein FQN49_005485 [Arthroderma sp. PD_2]
MSLPSLPTEILDEFVKSLPYVPHLTLTFTCRALYAKIKPPIYSEAVGTESCSTACDEDLIEGLLTMESWREYSPDVASSHSHEGNQTIRLLHLFPMRFKHPISLGLVEMEIVLPLHTRRGATAEGLEGDLS